MKPMQQSGLGMFQYVADLTLIFSSRPIHVRTSDNQQRGQQQQQELIPRKVPIAKGHEGISEMGEKRDMESVRSDGKPLLPIRSLRGQKGPNVPVFVPSDSMGRSQLLKNMADQLFSHLDGQDGDEGVSSEEERQGETHALRSEGNGLEDGFGNILLSEGILDMRNGVAHSYFVEEKIPTGSQDTSGISEGEGEDDIEKESEAAPEEVEIETLKAHHRQWFVSSVDHVAVGVMSCADVSAADVNGINSDGSEGTTRERNKSNSTGTHTKNNSNNSDAFMEDSIPSSSPLSLSSCLNVAVRLTRDSGPNNPPPTSIKAERMVEGMAFGRILETAGDEGEGFRSDSFAVQLSLKSGNGLTLPNVVSCGIIRCISSSAGGAKSSNSNSSASDIGGSLGHIAHTGTFRGAWGSEAGKEKGQGNGNGKASSPGSVPVVICNGASAMEIIMSVVESGTHFILNMSGGDAAVTCNYSKLDALYLVVKLN